MTTPGWGRPSGGYWSRVRRTASVAEAGAANSRSAGSGA
jgi:hypothetical protein